MKETAYIKDYSIFIYTNGYHIANLKITAITILFQEVFMKFGKHIIALTCFSVFATQAMQESKEPKVPSEPKEILAAHTAKSSLLSADEVARIQDHMYNTHRYQMNLLKGPDFFAEMAHGNEDLEKDIRSIYQCRGYSSAMLALHGLCKKWEFDTSKLTND